MSFELINEDMRNAARQAEELGLPITEKIVSLLIDCAFEHVTIQKNEDNTFDILSYSNVQPRGVLLENLVTEIRKVLEWWPN